MFFPDDYTEALMTKVTCHGAVELRVKLLD
jgi:hypothetical protein